MTTPQTTSKAKLKLAQALKQQRLSRHLARQKVAKQLQLPDSTLKALESADDDSLSLTHRQGLSRRYGEQLGLDREQLNELTAALVVESDEQVVVAPKRREGLKLRSSLVASRLAQTLVVMAVLGAVLGYAVWQARSLTLAPRLTLDRPAAAQQLRSSEYELKGRSTPDATVLVNGQTVPVNDDGSFAVTLYLQPGLNLVEITAVNSFARRATLIQELYAPPLD